MKSLLLALLLAACATTTPPPAVPPVTVSLAAAATLRVNVQAYDGENEEWVTEGYGTAWIARNEAVSFLVTAGHVCDGEGYTLTGRDGTEYNALVVKVDPAYDLCLIRSEYVIGPELRLSAEAPTYDHPLAAVGAPLGVYGCEDGSCGMAPISRGFYAGGTLVSMPMYGGNSGSAVFTEQGVIGVLVQGYRQFPMLSFVEPLDHLQAFLAQ